MKPITIEPLVSIAQAPYALLYLADPSEDAVSDYLRRGDTFTVSLEGTVVAVMVLLPTRPFTLELVNLAVDPGWQRQGIARALIQFARQRAKALGFHLLEVGTGNSSCQALMLYQRCGFSICGIELDFFRHHYAEPIWEEGIECRHMIRLAMNLMEE